MPSGNPPGKQRWIVEQWSNGQANGKPKDTFLQKSESVSEHHIFSYSPANNYLIPVLIEIALSREVTIEHISQKGGSTLISGSPVGTFTKSEKKEKNQQVHYNEGLPKGLRAICGIQYIYIYIYTRTHFLGTPSEMVSKQPKLVSKHPKYNIFIQSRHCLTPSFDAVLETMVQVIQSGQAAYPAALPSQLRLSRGTSFTTPANDHGIICPRSWLNAD